MPNRLNETEIQERLKSLEGWELQDGALMRTFTLPSFAHGVLMIGAVGQLAEAADHHPDLYLFAYKKLTVTLLTHSAGGLTEKDFSLAKQIQALPQR